MTGADLQSDTSANTPVHPVGLAETQHQTAMAPRVARIILDQLALSNDDSNFIGTDHALRP